MKYTIKIEPDAQIDLEEAVLWYENQQKSLGEKFALEVYNKIEFIGENPKVYSVVFKNIRNAILDRFPFNIYFFLKNDSIHIFAIIHQSRNPNLIKKRSKQK